MDDVTAKTRSETAQPRLDFQEHLADLEAQGLLTRIDHPINKDTELHPLVRCSSSAASRRPSAAPSCSPTSSTAKGRRYDMPVVVGALAASPRIYALGMGQTVEEIGKRWMEAIAHPIPPVKTNAARCQEVVITGDDLRKPDGGLDAPAGADLDARASTPRRISRRRSASPGIRTTASRTWAPIAPR